MGNRPMEDFIRFLNRLRETSPAVKQNGKEPALALP